MISVIVERLPADRQGRDISDQLVTSDLVAIERGRNEIDANCCSRELVTGTGPLQGYLRPGHLVEVADSEQQMWRGMIRSCAITVSRDNNQFSADVNLEIERKATL